MGRRWALVAIVILALFTACTSDGSQDLQTPELETETVQLAVLHDFGVSATTPDTKLSDVGAETIEVGEGRAAILAIERPSASGRCMNAAQLRLYLEDRSELADEQLAIYPSHVFNAADKRDGDEFGYSGSALDTRPRATMQDGGSGWSRWDVSDIVSTWMNGRFPSKGARVPERGPIVLTLRDVEGAEPFATATFVSSDAAENTPHVIVTHTKGCS